MDAEEIMKSHGTGLPPWDFRRLGNDTVFETGVLIFHPENIEIGDDVYIGHQAILKGYYRNLLRIGRGSWIGQQCFLHSGGGLTIGEEVGIGPGVKILTSHHGLKDPSRSIMHQGLSFEPVHIGKGSDIGANAVILPGVTLGERCQVGAGAVVTQSFPANAIIAGVPAKQMRTF